MQNEIEKTKHEKGGTLADLYDGKSVWNDIRKKHGLDPIPDGDVVLISKYDNNRALNQ